MISIGLGLAVSICLGTADFVGGAKARALPAFSVVVTSQAAGLLALLPVMAILRPPLPGAPQVGAAVAAGVTVCVGTTALYRGLAVGTMSIVAPISATSALVPVVVGVLGGEALSSGQAAGSAIAIAGVMLAARASAAPGAARSRPAGTGFALLAAAGGGAFIVAIGSVGSANVLWAAALARLTALCIMVPVARLAPAGGRRPVFAREPAVVVIGLLEVGSWIMLVAAVADGQLSIVGVVASLYPVVTVILARAVYAERLRGPQAAGAAAVLAGVILLAAA